MARQPAIFVPHGGGPWPFVDLKRLMLKVMAGAAGGELGRVTFSELWLGARVRAAHFGA